MKLNLTWKEKTDRYQTGKWAYLNRVCVGEYSWNAGRSKDNADNLNWVGKINLPSIKKSILYGSTHEDIQAKLEQVITTWFNEVLAL